MIIMTPSLRETAISAGIIAVVCLFVYGGSLANNFVQFDDNILITSNPAVAHFSFSSVKHVFTSYDPELYVPLTLFTFQLERLFFGFNPFVFHLVSLLFHIGNACLLFLLLYPLVQRRWIAFAGALLFAIHPQNTEAVSWASGLKDVLAMFFGLASLVAYEKAEETKSRRMLVMSIVLFLLGLLSKAVLIPLPAVLFLFDWYKRRPFTRKRFTEKIPHVLLSIIFVIIALFGKQELLVETTLLQKILMAAKSTVFYLQTFFVPAHLVPIYPYTKDIVLSSPDFFVPLIVVFILTAVAIFSLCRTRVVLFGWLLFLAFLAPTFVNFSKGGALYFASDRYAYIPSIGLIIILTVCITSLLERMESSRLEHILKQASMIFGIILAVIVGLLAREQSDIWHDTKTLFTRTLEVYPNAVLARNNLANIKRDEGDLEGALQEYQAALEVHPNNAVVLNNMGIVYRSQGKNDEAVAAYEKAMELRPDFADAPYNRGYLEFTRGNKEEAMNWYKKALEIDPHHLRSRIAISVILSDANQDLDAMKILAEGATLQPDIAEYPYNLAILLEKNGKRKEAHAMYLHAVELNPYHISALNNLGAMAVEDESYPEARMYFERALKLSPNDADLLYNLESLP